MFKICALEYRRPQAERIQHMRALITARIEQSSTVIVSARSGDSAQRDSIESIQHLL